MNTIVRLQDYFRRSAAQRYETISVPPFSLFIHPTDDFPGYNYAIPDRPIVDGVHQALLQVKQVYGARGRQPRFEFVEEYSPRFPAELVHERWIEEERNILMVCTPGAWRAAAAVERLDICTVRAGEVDEMVRQFILAQRLGFSEADAAAVGEDEIEQFRPTLAAGVAFLASVNRIPAGTAMYTTLIEGTTELVGIATVPQYRRRGIAAAITAHALQAAFADGVEVACLSASDTRAGNIYQRVGFQPMGTMLAYTGPI